MARMTHAQLVSDGEPQEFTLTMQGVHKVSGVDTVTTLVYTLDPSDTPEDVQTTIDTEFADT